MASFLLGEKSSPPSSLNFEKRSDLITLADGIFPIRLRDTRRLCAIGSPCPVPLLREERGRGKILIRSCEVGSFVTLPNAFVRSFVRSREYCPLPVKALYSTGSHLNELKLNVDKEKFFISLFQAERTVHLEPVCYSKYSYR